jgi:hypothetical protein
MPPAITAPHDTVEYSDALTSVAAKVVMYVSRSHKKMKRPHSPTAAGAARSLGVRRSANNFAGARLGLKPP